MNVSKEISPNIFIGSTTLVVFFKGGKGNAKNIEIKCSYSAFSLTFNAAIINYYYDVQACIFSTSGMRTGF